MASEHWKYKSEGKEYPLKEQLARREADLVIAKLHKDWYRKHPLFNGAVKRDCHDRDLRFHIVAVQNDIFKLEKLIEIDTRAIHKI